MTTVPSRALARQAKPDSTSFLISTLSLISAVLIHGVTGLDLAWTVFVILVVVVVVPGVHAWEGYRRVVGLDVGGCLLS